MIGVIRSILVVHARNWRTDYKITSRIKKSAVYKYRQYKPKIELIVEAPSKNRKLLEHVENKWIAEHCIKYEDRLFNIKSNPAKQKKVKFKVELDTDKQLQEIIQKLGIPLRITDDSINKLLYYDGVVDGKRYKTKARYNKCTKDEASSKLTNKQKQLIDELTIDFN